MKDFTIYFKIDGELFNRHVLADCEYDALLQVPSNAKPHRVIAGKQPLFK